MPGKWECRISRISEFHNYEFYKYPKLDEKMGGKQRIKPLESWHPTYNTRVVRKNKYLCAVSNIRYQVSGTSDDSLAFQFGILCKISNIMRQTEPMFYSVKDDFRLRKVTSVIGPIGLVKGWSLK